MHYHDTQAMRRGPFIWTLVLALLGVIVALIVATLHDGLSARATPSRLEALLARSMRNLAIPSSAKKLTNSASLTPQTLREARLHFADHCSVCHGNDGGGITLFGLGLYPKPPDLRLAQTQQLSDGELFWIIENGVRFTGMPAFAGHGGAEEDSWKLVHFIRHLPHLAPDELAEMDRYNPKGPEERLEEQQEEDFLTGKPDEKQPANSKQRPAKP
jgi:mono/diheme cytochrome c family protein